MKKIFLLLLILNSHINFGQVDTKKLISTKEVVYTNLTLNEYQKLISSDKKTLVDFNAKWCGPCKKIAPYIKKINEEMKGELLVIKIDADKNPDLVRELKIEGLPTLILYKNGAKKWENLGYLQEEKLRQLIKTEQK